MNKQGVKNTSSQTCWLVKDIKGAVMHSWFNLFTVEIPTLEHALILSLISLKWQH